MLTPEQHARQLIDAQLALAGWLVQDYKLINLGAGAGVAVQEYPTDSGPADYALLVDRKLVGIVEAKREGTSLTAVAEQTARYQASATKHAQRVADQLPSATRPTARKSASPTPATRSPAPGRCSAFTGPRPCASGLGSSAAPFAPACACCRP